MDGVVTVRVLTLATVVLVWITLSGGSRGFLAAAVIVWALRWIIRNG